MPEYIGAWLTLLIEPDVSVFLWYKAGNHFGATFIYLSLYTSLATILMFWGIGELKNIKRVGFIHRLGRKLWLKIKNKLPFYKEAENGHNLAQKRTVSWFKRRGVIIIFLASCLPILPIIPTATIAVTKLLEIRHGLILMLIGALIRNALVILIIYSGVSFFFQ